jgi:hypothetical protein
MSGPALVFEGEEAMITAISENPATFKVPLLYSSIKAHKIALLMACLWNILISLEHYGKLFYCNATNNREK